MARFNDRVRVTPTALRHFSGALKQLADIQEKQADAMEVAGVAEVEAKNLKTALRSLVHLGKFIGSATTSFCDQLNEEGVSELEGAVLQFNRYLKRRLPDPMRDHAKYQQHAEAEEHQAADEIAERLGVAKKKRKAKGT